MKLCLYFFNLSIGQAKAFLAADKDLAHILRDDSFLCHILEKLPVLFLVLLDQLESVDLRVDHADRHGGRHAIVIGISL